MKHQATKQRKPDKVQLKIFILGKWILKIITLIKMIKRTSPKSKINHPFLPRRLVSQKMWPRSWRDTSRTHWHQVSLLCLFWIVSLMDTCHCWIINWIRRMLTRLPEQLSRLCQIYWTNYTWSITHWRTRVWLHSLKDLATPLGWRAWVS